MFLFELVTYHNFFVRKSIKLEPFLPCVICEAVLDLQIYLVFWLRLPSEDSNRQIRVAKLKNKNSI